MKTIVAILGLALARDYTQNRYFAIETENINTLLDSGYRLESVLSIPNHYLVSLPRLSKRNVHTELWHEEQVPYQHLYKRTGSPYEHVYKRTGRISQIRSRLNITDPEFGRQWHIINEESIGFDLNVTGVWEQGVTGRNVTVALMDDGIDHENRDLKENFSLEGSYDFNEHKKLPTPSLWDDTHGTRCAGEIAAVKNDVCGVGVAYEAKVAGIRILSGNLANVDEAAAVNYAMNTTQIYSCSWGPRDDGRTMENPPKLVAKAFRHGIEKGRNGLGSIFVFAAGNGAGSRDNCNFDGYTNSIFTITVAAMDNYQRHPPYSEQCPAILISTYSSAGGGMAGLVTTDWKKGCTDRHGGTSAAAPLGAGITKVTRPDLNWRDVQRLTVENAIIVNPTDSDWKLNGANRKYNHKYGYGTFDTYKLIQSARVYKNVGKQTVMELKSGNLNLAIPHKGKGVSHSIQVDQSFLRKHNFKRLEHITLTVNITHQRRGDVEIHVVSPSGMVSRMIESRYFDEATTGFPNWQMSSNAHWDESPIGTWTVTVFDVEYEQKVGTVHDWTLKLFAEELDSPARVSSVPSLPVSTSHPSSVSSTPTPRSSTTSIPVQELPSGTGIGHYVSNTPILLIILVLILCTILVGGLAYRLGWFKRKAKDYQFEELEEFEDSDFDHVALRDLEKGERETLFESRE